MRQQRSDVLAYVVILRPLAKRIGVVVVVGERARGDRFELGLSQTHKKISQKSCWIHAQRLLKCAGFWTLFRWRRFVGLPSLWL